MLSSQCVHNFATGIPQKTSTLSQRKGRAPQPSIAFSCQAGGEVVGGPSCRGWGVWGVLHDKDNNNDDTYMTPIWPIRLRLGLKTEGNFFSKEMPANARFLERKAISNGNSNKSFAMQKHFFPDIKLAAWMNRENEMHQSVKLQWGKLREKQTSCEKDLWFLSSDARSVLLSGACHQFQPKVQSLRRHLKFTGGFFFKTGKCRIFLWCQCQQKGEENLVWRQAYCVQDKTTGIDLKSSSVL